MLAAIFSRGHCLLVGVPGLAKTLMVSTLSRIMTLSFKRIQFTPDLMPSDITGTNVIDEVSLAGGGTRREFRFVRGPIFREYHPGRRNQPHAAQDAGGAASGDAGARGHLRAGDLCPSQPVLRDRDAEPIEQEGTYPLPEAQQDRFMFNLWVDYPDLAEEQRILAQTTSGRQPQLAPY